MHTSSVAPTVVTKFAYAIYDAQGELQQKGATHPARDTQAAAYAALAVCGPRPEEGWRVKVKRIGGDRVRTFVVNRSHLHGLTVQAVDDAT